MTIVYMFAALILGLVCGSALAWGFWAALAVLCGSMLGVWMAAALVSGATR